MTRTHLQPVSNDLPIYPIERDERLPELAFIKWYPSRWLNSKGHLLCSYEVQGVARALFDLAAQQSPIGTLPDDDEELALLLRLAPPQWAALRRLGDRGPMRGWTRCLSDGEVRMMHPVVLAGMQDVLERRERRQMSMEAQAEVKRLDRLRKALKGMGLGDAALADDVLIGRMDEWLTATCRGNRTALVYQRALVHAQASGWFRQGAALGGG